MLNRRFDKQELYQQFILYRHGSKSMGASRMTKSISSSQHPPTREYLHVHDTRVLRHEVLFR